MKSYNYTILFIVYATVCNSLAVVCTGLSRGVCECGTCRCRSGYTGMSCECPTSDETCRGTNGLICNGQGTCQCGMCFCNDYYTGATCQVYMVSSGLVKSYQSSTCTPFALRITYDNISTPYFFKFVYMYLFYLN